MEKLRMQSHDVIGSNTQKIAQLFPNCATERLGKDGKPELAIDFEKLQAELSNEIIADGEERYQFTWPDKRAAVRLANTPTTMTLRPCREESVDFDNTQNLYIEGDNLDVLKVLRETYLGKVKMIYIDPPYNTGNDFVYNDDFGKDKGTFEETSGLFDEDGNQTIDPMQRNTESNGRFHTDWLNMIYPRLKVARDLLTDDGVIFISIDDNEVDNLKKVCDEIFGANNFIDIYNWAKTETPENLSIKCRQIIEYVICYQKNKDNVKFRGIQKFSSSSNGLLNQPNAVGTLKFPANRVKTSMSDRHIAAGMYGTDKYNVELLDDVDIKGGLFVNEFRLRAKFKWQQSYLDNELKNGTIINIPTSKLSPSYEKKEYDPEVPTNLINSKVGVGTNENAGEHQLEIFERKVFNFPKPTSLMKYLMGFNYNTDEQYIVLDFFSGSASTAEAVIEFNLENKENPIQYIMVQIAEDLEEAKRTASSKSQQEIVQNAIDLCNQLKVPAVLTEVAKERIRRAGKKIASEREQRTSKLDSMLSGSDLSKVKEEAGLSAQNLDIGFRVLKLDSSNMEDVYYTPQEFESQSLFNENVKADRTNEDLLFQVMLDLGIELSAKIDSKQIAGKNVHLVDDNYLVACFDRDVNESTITEIAKLQPIYFVMRDASAANDNVIDNFEQIFKHYSPDTNCRII